MDKQISKDIKTAFAAELSRQLPNFRKTRRMKATGVFEAYRWSAASDLYCYVLLVLSPKAENRFTIEIAWSRKQEISPTLTDVNPGRHSGRFRLSRLWASNPEKWWWIGEEPSLESLATAILKGGRTDEKLNKAEVESKVREAVEQVRRYAVPYFEDLAHPRSSEI